MEHSCLLGHKESYNNVHQVKIIEIVFSDHNAIKFKWKTKLDTQTGFPLKKAIKWLLGKRKNVDVNYRISKIMLI